MTKVKEKIYHTADFSATMINEAIIGIIENEMKRYPASEYAIETYKSYSLFRITIYKY